VKKLFVPSETSGAPNREFRLTSEGSEVDIDDGTINDLAQVFEEVAFKKRFPVIRKEGGGFIFEKELEKTENENKYITLLNEAVHETGKSLGIDDHEIPQISANRIHLFDPKDVQKAVTFTNRGHSVVMKRGKEEDYFLELSHEFAHLISQQKLSYVKSDEKPKHTIKSEMMGLFRFRQSTEEKGRGEMLNEAFAEFLAERLRDCVRRKDPTLKISFQVPYEMHVRIVEQIIGEIEERINKPRNFLLHIFLKYFLTGNSRFLQEVMSELPTEEKKIIRDLFLPSTDQEMKELAKKYDINLDKQKYWY